MIVGVPKEIKDNEFRVGLVPSGVDILTNIGHQVVIERGAGEGSGIADREYVKAGATLVDTAEDVFDRAEMVVKVKEPLPQECELIKEGQIIFTFLHLAAFQQLTETMLDSKCIGIGYETIQLDDGSLPLLKPMSEVAGRLAPQMGAYHLIKACGGKGMLLGGVPGVERAKVTIIGGGVVGSNAAKIAIGLGAEVYLLDTKPRRLAYLDDIFGNAISTVISNPMNIARLVGLSDLVIGAVLIPGEKAPTIVTREMISTMAPGSVVVDVAIDQGGCFETSKATSHSSPIYEVEGVLHYCVANIPGVVAKTSTFALTNATLPYIVEIATKGWEKAAKGKSEIGRGINVARGDVTCRGVAEACNLRYVPVDNFLQG